MRLDVGAAGGGAHLARADDLALLHLSHESRAGHDKRSEEGARLFARTARGLERRAQRPTRRDEERFEIEFRLELGLELGLLRLLGADEHVLRQQRGEAAGEWHFDCVLTARGAERRVGARDGEHHEQRHKSRQRERIVGGDLCVDRIDTRERESVRRKPGVAHEGSQFILLQRLIEFR